MKKKASAFVSILPRRKTRSTSFAEVEIGWKSMEHTILVLLPLSTMIDEETITQEPVSSSNLTVLLKTPINNGMGIQGQVGQDEVVTQEPTIQDEPVTQEANMTNMTVTQEPAIQYELVPQEAVMIDTFVTQETTVPPEATIDSITAP
jgi:hypothetical protein